MSYRFFLLPNDPNDQSNAFLEIRAGTGGDEAAIFAGDLLKMYLRYAEGMRWNIEILSDREGEHGGSKRSLRVFLGAMYTAISNLNRAHIGCSAFHKLNLKDAFTRRRAP